MSQSPAEGLRLQKEGIPEGLWMRCPQCGDMLFRKVVEEALHVCPGCQYHFRVSARTRIELIADPGTFEERFTDVSPTDPLEIRAIVSDNKLGATPGAPYMSASDLYSADNGGPQNPARQNSRRRKPQRGTEAHVAGPDRDHQARGAACTHTWLE